MKRRNLNEASIAPCFSVWSVISFLLVLCLFSCACRTKTNAVQLNSVDSSSIANSQGQGFVQTYTDPDIINSNYNQIITEVKARSGYTLFAEFLERGKYADVMMRMDKMNYCILVPSDDELKKLDNATLTQLIYPEMPNKSNLDFLFSHVAFTPIEAKTDKSYRTMASKIVNIDAESKNITIDGKQFPVIDEAKLPPSIRILFIDHYLN